MGAGSYIVAFLNEEPSILFLKSTLFLCFWSAVAPYLLGVSDVLGLSVQGASLFLALIGGVPYGMLDTSWGEAHQNQ